MAKKSGTTMLDEFVAGLQEIDTASGIGVTKDYGNPRTVCAVAAHVYAQHPDWSMEIGGAGRKILTLSGNREGNAVFYDRGSVVPAKIALPELYELTQEDKEEGDKLFEAWTAKVKADAKAAKERAAKARVSVASHAEAELPVE